MQVTLVAIPTEMLCGVDCILLFTHIRYDKQRVRQQLAISNQDANASTKLKKRQQIHIKDDI